MISLDLHGTRHYEVDHKVENFILMNQDSIPLTIICGNSQKMISLVEEVLTKIESSFEVGSGINYGTIMVRSV